MYGCILKANKPEPFMGHARVVTAQLPEDLNRRLDDAAHRLDRSKGWVVKAALEEWLAEEERRHALTLEALADVDAGRLIDQADVERWAAGLKEARTSGPA
jgi:predicted transcriptional regulator